MKHPLCLNCGGPVKQKFCPACGQSASVHRYSFSGLMHDLPHALWHIDSGFPSTFVRLWKSPGTMIFHFLKGKRVGITNPFLFLFVSAGFMVLLFHLFPVLPTEKGNIFNTLDNIEMHLIENPKWSFSLAFLISGFFSWVFYSNAGFNFIEHCVMNAFIGGSIAIATILLHPFSVYWSESPLILDLTLIHILVLQVVYPGLVFHRVMKAAKQKSSWFKAMLCSFTGTLCFTAITTILF